MTKQDRSHQDLAAHWHVTPNWPVVAPKAAPKDAAGLCAPFIFDNSTGWLGFFVMQAEHRGKGWGAAVFQATMDVFKENGVEYIGLDGVPEQKKTYERRGFREVSKIRNMMREGIEKESVEGGSEAPEGMRFVDARDIVKSGPLKIVEYEEKVTGFKRSKLWGEEGVWKRPETDAFGYVAMSKDDEIEGLVIVKDCENGMRVGPIYAKSEALAKSLLNAGMARTAKYGSGTLGAEVNMENKAAVKLFEDAGWKDAGVDYSRVNQPVPFKSRHC